MKTTRRRKVKARSCRETDILSHCDNVDVILGGDKINFIQRELAITTNSSVSHHDTEAFSHSTYRENASQQIETKNIGGTGGTTRPDRLLESMETLSGELSLKLSQVIGSLMNILQAQISRAINSAIIDSVIPEIQKISVCCLLDRETPCPECPLIITI